MRRSTLFLTIPFLIACNNKPDSIGGQSGQRSTPPAQPQASSMPLTASPASSAKISTTSTPASMASSVASSAGASGDPVVRSSGGNIDIDYNDGGQHHHLRGYSRGSGKRKYALDNGPEVLEVKPGEGHFKVRKTDGSLLWKVKMDPNKIKVSDNEENRDAVEIRNGSHGVLDIQKIPIMQRAVIYAELLDRKL